MGLQHLRESTRYETLDKEPLLIKGGSFLESKRAVKAFGYTVGELEPCCHPSPH